ncbi:MAG: papain-like cysteine protease family protein [Kiritimatiellae bacterium]|nr:papain-like cysteine protease family protein [Kiritimatiellia bacterium]
MNIRHCTPKFIAVAVISILTATGACPGAKLNVPQYKQEKDQWCWDAGSQMVLAFKGYSYSQTAIANWAVGGRNIPNYLYGSTDSSMHGCDEILKHFGNISSSGSASRMSLNNLNTEINNSRPVLIRYGWNSGGGHIAVLRGTSGSSVYVNDPWYGQSLVSYNYVCQAYNQGSWTHTLKLTGGSSSYYQYAMYYYGLYGQYWSAYQSTGSYYYLSYAYYYYAYAIGYYYLYCGDSSSANYYYNYYMQYAQYYYNLYYYAYYYSYYHNYYSYYYNYYLRTGSYVALAYAYYYYAYVEYCYYMYYGNSSYANYLYNYYMYWANYVYNHYC